MTPPAAPVSVQVTSAPTSTLSDGSVLSETTAAFPGVPHTAPTPLRENGIDCGGLRAMTAPGRGKRYDGDLEPEREDGSRGSAGRPCTADLSHLRRQA